jgi:hypothetical protein
VLQDEAEAPGLGGELDVGDAAESEWGEPEEDELVGIRDAGDMEVEEEEEEVLDMLEAVNADAGGIPLPSQTPTPPPDIQDQPFMNGFHLLSDTLEDGQTGLWDLLEEKDLDVDSREIATSPPPMSTSPDLKIPLPQ